jgi:DNA polymerase
MAEIAKLDRQTVEQLLAQETLSLAARRVLELRLAGAQAAVKKLDSALLCAGADDRIRDASRYHGAATGRWAGQRFQPQNLKRPIVEDIDAAVAAVRSSDIEQVKAQYPRPLSVIGDVSHAMIVAAPGHEMIGGDFATIEARVLAHAAGEKGRLDAFRRYDATGDLADHIYVVAAAKVLRIPPSSIRKGSAEYHTGKVCELSFGYQGRLGAWRQFDRDQHSDEAVLAFCDAWRAEHPAICRFWYDLDRAAVEAVQDRGRVVSCREIRFKCSAGFLLLRLPSGRRIAYPEPRLRVEDGRRPSVIFKDNAASQFRDTRMYGGLLAENVASGIARDLLVAAMWRVEAAGYPIVMHVHDELVAEVPEGFGSEKEFQRLMIQRPAWAPDLPIAAGVWRGPRYRK